MGINTGFRINIIFLFCSFLAVVSCNSKAKTSEQKIDTTNSAIIAVDTTNTQIAQYIIDIFEDSKGNLWFGTIEKGVAKYTGKELRYYTTADGLIGNTVKSILEDVDGNLWFGTEMGLSKYNGKTFVNFTKKEGLCHNNISDMLIDTKGNFWIGTWAGICLFNGSSFTSFTIPKPKVDSYINVDTKNWITEIMEDSKGNIWFGSDAYGVSSYNGTSFTTFTKKEGFASNSIHAITEDNSGTMWFGSRMIEKDYMDSTKQLGTGGLTSYNGKTVTNYPNIKGLHTNDVYGLYTDHKNNVWISTTAEGVYKYTGNTFVNYKFNTDTNTSSNGIQNIFQDKNGTFWFGCSGGLFKLKDAVIINVSRESILR